MLLSFSSGPVARVQANDTSSNSTTVITSTPTSSYTMSSSSSYSTTDDPTSTDTSAVTTSSSTSATSSSSSSISTYNSLVTVTTTSTTTSTSSSAGYSINFSSDYWFCTPISVSFTGPLVESGYYGDTLQFQYYQYNPSYPSVLTPIFTDSGLTVTSDTVNYWIGAGEYAPVNFAYQPNLAVKVVDVTPKSNGAPPGLLYMQLTNINPATGPNCAYDPSIPTPEFQFQWLMILTTLILGLVFLRVHKQYHLLSGRQKN